MGNTTQQFFQNMVAEQHRGCAVGVPSICSANRFVLEAAVEEARRNGTPVLIESTSNQVDQFGGYTGMTPAQFVRFVQDVTAGAGLPSGQVILGGDHLGPNAWREERASEAMEKARGLVRAYVEAGYTKIHLDASMHCADDPGDRHHPLSVLTVAERAADLCTAAESAVAAGAAECAPVYVIGTEVPVPGGAQERLEEVAATRVEDAAETVEVTREAFFNRGLHDAWERVIAVVVQPGVEFGDNAVVAYDRQKAAPLARWIETVEGLVYEAHSTDYQTGTALREMVQDHFAILKVGPWLTFAFREAVFALAQIEAEWLGGRKSVELSRLPEVLERVMVADPEHWRKHYHGSEHELRLARRYSYSDRSRYYWPQADVQQALARLCANLEDAQPPLTLLSQYLPSQYHAVRKGALANTPGELVGDRIAEVIRMYNSATLQSSRSRVERLPSP